LEVIVVPTDVEVGRLGAAKVAAALAAKPAAVIGLATGSSPESLYADLRERVAAGRISFAEARGFALDEYVGLPLEHPESYADVIRRTVVEPLGFDPGRVRVPDGLAPDIDAAATAYEAAIAEAGGVDIQILGIGTNGHLGFNEPTSSFASRTRVKALAPSTREDNSRFFGSLDEVPIHCVTQGLGTILEARELLLVAQGRGKAAAVAAAVEGPLSSFVPASALQLHQRATVIVDEAAAAELRLIEYYRFSHDHRLVRTAAAA
jgi:glucosamine-6-phosphate deaminase